MGRKSVVTSKRKITRPETSYKTKQQVHFIQCLVNHNDYLLILTTVSNYYLLPTTILYYTTSFTLLYICVDLLLLYCFFQVELTGPELDTLHSYRYLHYPALYFIEKLINSTLDNQTTNLLGFDLTTTLANFSYC